MQCSLAGGQNELVSFSPFCSRKRLGGVLLDAGMRSAFLAAMALGSRERLQLQVKMSRLSHTLMSRAFKLVAPIVCMGGISTCCDSTVAAAAAGTTMAPPRQHSWLRVDSCAGSGVPN
jgi:hypothetical protein